MKVVQMITYCVSVNVYIHEKSVQMSLTGGMVHSPAVSWPKQIGLPVKMVLLSGYCPPSRQPLCLNGLAVRGKT